MRNQVLLLMTICLLVSCKKNNDAVKFQGTYYSSSMFDVSLPEMYVNSGLINDTSFIKNYLKRNSVLNYFEFSSDFINTVQGALTITFTGNDSVIIKNGANVVSASTTWQTIDRLLLTLRDSSDWNISAQYSRCDTIRLSLAEYKPKCRIIPLPAVTGYSHILRGRQVMPLTIKNHSLFIPIHSVSYSHKSSSWYCHATFYLDNYISPQFKSNIPAGDTLVVQQRELPMLKQ